jgi:uracil-DNA glycosylase family 4
MYCKTIGPPNAKIMLIAEAPGKDEHILGVPFVGAAGKILNQLLGQAGIARHEVLITNVAREQPPGNRISFYFEDSKCTVPKPILREWIETLKKEIILYQPNLLIALGNTALWALTGEKKISEFRGYVLPCKLVEGKKVLATYHPAAILHDWKLFFPTVMDLRKGVRQSEFPSIQPDKRVLISDAPVSQFIQYCEELLQKPEVWRISVDIETIQPGTHISVLGIAHDSGFAMSTRILNGRTSVLTEGEEVTLWRVFGRLVNEKSVIMQNASYDVGVLWYNQHILCKNIYMDTLLAAHSCWPELPRDLGFLASLCIEVPPWKGSSKENLSLYNAADCANTFAIAEVLEKELKKTGNWDTFQFEMKEIPVSLMMQLQGLYVDKGKQKELIKEAEIKRDEAKKQLHSIFGKDINYDSPKQLQQLLYIDMGLPVQYKRRKSASEPRTITADANALRKLARIASDNPVFNLILDYKKNNKLITGFLDVTLSSSDRVHTSYNITGSSTDDEGRKSFGRWSSSSSIILPYGSGNLQNIPSQARKMYTARDGFTIIQADYVQAEAVVVFYLTNNQKYKKLQKDSFGLRGKDRIPYDIHIHTAVDLFGVSFDLVTEAQRKVGKTVRHAVHYNAGPNVVANSLGCSLKAAKLLIDLFNAKDPLLRIWHTGIQEKLRQNRILTNCLGRKHRFLGRWGDELFRSAYSYIPQSTVGDLLNLSLVKIYDELGNDVEILLQLHDALYIQVPDMDVEGYIMELYKRMIRPIEVNKDVMTIDVDFKTGKDWGTLVPWKGSVE